MKIDVNSLDKYSENGSFEKFTKKKQTQTQPTKKSKPKSKNKRVYNED